MAKIENNKQLFVVFLRVRLKADLRAWANWVQGVLYHLILIRRKGEVDLVDERLDNAALMRHVGDHGNGAVVTWANQSRTEDDDQDAGFHFVDVALAGHA